MGVYWLCVWGGGGAQLRKLFKFECLNDKHFKKKIIILCFVVLIACKNAYMKNGGHLLEE